MIVSGDDLYGVLGVGPSATTEDIAEAFARREPSGDANARDAYDILRDPGRRRGYDDTRRARSDAAAAARSSQHDAAGDDDVELELSFDQAALGTTAKLHIAVPTVCSVCEGAGARPGDPCSECAGVGFNARTSEGINIRTECRSCEGAGRGAPMPCHRCDGRGVVNLSRAVTLRVPAGVGDGARLRFMVPDEAGETERHAVVHVAPHPYFTRGPGNDLSIRLPITIAEAVFGATVTVPTLSGAIAIRIPPATPPGRTFRIRGQGIPAASGAGDLLASIDLVISADLNDQQREALEAFAAATPSPRQHFS